MSWIILEPQNHDGWKSPPRPSSPTVPQHRQGHHRPTSPSATSTRPWNNSRDDDSTIAPSNLCHSQTSLIWPKPLCFLLPNRKLLLPPSLSGFMLFTTSKKSLSWFIRKMVIYPLLIWVLKLSSSQHWGIQQAVWEYSHTKITRLNMKTMRAHTSHSSFFSQSSRIFLSALYTPINKHEETPEEKYSLYPLHTFLITLKSIQHPEHGLEFLFYRPGKRWIA